MKRDTEEQVLVFIESLTMISWLFSVLPYLIYQYFRYRQKKYKIYFIDTSKSGIFIAKVSLVILGLRHIEKLDFRLIDIRDEEGNLLCLRLLYFDFTSLQQDICKSGEFQSLLQQDYIKGRMPVFLTKQIVGSINESTRSIGRALFLIHIACWKLKQAQMENINALLFMDRRIWMDIIKRYAFKYNVNVVSVNNIRFNIKDFLFWILGDNISIFKNIYFSGKNWKSTLRRLVKSNKERKSGNLKNRVSKAKLVVEYYGHLNLERPELNSDLFFYQQSSLSGGDILLMFNKAVDLLDEKKNLELVRRGIEAVALSGDAVSVDSVPIFYHWPKKRQLIECRDSKLTRINASYEKRWLFQQVRDYYRKYDYWLSFFSTYNAKVFISWFKYSSLHCVIADAMQAYGGVTAIYQRAFEDMASVETRISCDVVFGFSPLNAEVERRSRSRIAYHVATGYFGDHRFVLVKKLAQEIREKLRRRGAKRIIAFFDENSGNDSRWHTGHEFMRINYEFLLGKVLSIPWLGVVFKPKVPSSLRRRLGKVTKLLQSAEKNGRCLVIEGGTMHSSYPPVLAALASDIAIHGHLCAATAGMESALAGVPTLLLDREGWLVSSLYRLGRGRVVFNDWDYLWKACEDHWNTPMGMPGFGDWSEIIDQIDPFRDGRAAERIGTYLKWLLDGLNRGLKREIVLADAAERYVDIWGRDKVVEIHSREEKTVDSFLKV